jgi:hypothetical protein
MRNTNTMYKLIYASALFLMPLAAMSQQAVGGSINMPNGNAVCEVLVELRDASNEVIDQDLSDENGVFEFANNLTLGEDYSLGFSKETNALNGPSTVDLVLLFRIILGIDIASPYALWAADVNGSGQMTTLDMVLIRRLILAIDDEFDVTNWAFDQPDVLAADNTIEIPNFSGSVDVTVIGVKRGDLNFSADSTCQ